MSFDDLFNSLSSSMAPQKMPDYYDLHLATHKDMQQYQRQAHIRSMLHSQRSDYGAKLRIVIDEQDELLPGADPWKIESYTTPDIAFAMQTAQETVIERDGRTFVVKSDARPVGFQ